MNETLDTKHTLEEMAMFFFAVGFFSGVAFCGVIVAVMKP